MRKMTGFFATGLLLMAMAAPAWAADTESATGHPSAGEAAAAPTIAPGGTALATYEPNRHGYHGDRYDRDRRYYRDGRHHDDGRYHYRDGRYHYRDGYYYGDDGYYRGRPTPDCPSGEWAYHPNTGWMCAG